VLVVVSASGTFFYGGSINQLVHRSWQPRYRVPTVSIAIVSWWRRGGLISYGVDVDNLFRGVRPPTFESHSQRRQKPADLPVQAPTKFELVINQEEKPLRH